LEARAAGLAASQEFVDRQEISPDGHIGDTCGWAFVKVDRPRYHFREALKSFRPGSFGFKAKWTVLGFGQREIGKAASQSLTAHEIACNSACAVLQRHFPEENFSSIHIWTDWFTTKQTRAFKIAP
jgi:hypothetical protein